MSSAATRLSPQPNSATSGFLTFGQAGPVLHTLARVFGLAGDEPLVTLFE
jgi:hypothetical protein